MGRCLRGGWTVVEPQRERTRRAGESVEGREVGREDAIADREEPFTQALRGRVRG
ncbi:MAG: hypothetical protein ACREM8_00310 [Vulcanimicrobiaceae bacterium]